MNCFSASKLFTEKARKGEMQVKYFNYCSQNKKSKFNFTSNQIVQFHYNVLTSRPLAFYINLTGNTSVLWDVRLYCLYECADLSEISLHLSLT